MGRRPPYRFGNRERLSAKRSSRLRNKRKKPKEAELAKARAAAAESKARGLEARLRQKEAVNQQAL